MVASFSMRLSLIPAMRLVLLVLFVAVSLPCSLFAGMQEILDGLKASEFRFARSGSEVPFLPAGWLTHQYYPDASFEANLEILPDAEVQENATSLGAFMPLSVQSRDMVLVGVDLSLDRIKVQSGPFRDQDVVRLTPVAAWMRQVNRNNLVAAFAAPIFSKEVRSGGEWGTGGYAGVVGLHWRSDTMQWVYGAVYENSFGRDRFYPYLGLQWNPHPRLSVSLVIPWPTITYAPGEDWILQMGISPGGSSWVSRQDRYEVTESFGSWNLAAGLGRRLYGHFWLVGSAGLAGLRAWQLGEDDSALRYEAKPGAVFTLALQFRP